MKKGQKAADLAPSHRPIIDYQRSSIAAERKQLCEVDETKNKLIICIQYINGIICFRLFARDKTHQINII